jgi:hypothetical protein
MMSQVNDRGFSIGFDTFCGTVTALANGGASTMTYQLRPVVDDSSEQWYIVFVNHWHAMLFCFHWALMG